MAVLGYRQLAQQIKVLLHKNFLIVVVRRPISFLLLLYGIPLGILAILLSVPDFLYASSSDTYGYASPAPIKSVAETLTRKLVIIRPPELGSDIDRIIDEITAPLDQSLIHYLDNEDDLASLCLANFRGVSDCHASISFVDSPLTTVVTEEQEQLSWANQEYDDEGNVIEDENAKNNHTWTYTIRADPAWDGAKFDATGHKSNQEDLYMPIVLALNNAITNSTEIPETFMFSSMTQAMHDKDIREQSAFLIGNIYVFALIVPYLIIVYRFCTFITAERESGMSQLIDAMGGRTANVARVISWLVAFDIACLPVFIISGILYWKILFPDSNVGILIGWQILLGLAVNSSAVFASAFFTKSRVSAIYIIGGFLLLAVGAQLASHQKKASIEAAYVLSALFPSSNHVYFTQQLCLWQYLSHGAQISQRPVVPGVDEQPVGSLSDKYTLATLLGLYAVQIIVYPMLAILVEHFMHGIDYRHRTFSKGSLSSTTTAAEVVDLQKWFKPNFFQRIFSRGSRDGVKAVNGVSLQGYEGQVLCLLGPNGSGKTTSLHMMAGFITPTAGSINLGAMPSQIGICPQQNTFWDELTVKEHVRLWRQLKAGRETAADLDQLIASCDLQLKRNSQARTLSGGQKRKLQLACMFVGDSVVCLIDECTSGLDPISRRAIWEILLQQRSKRSIILTTHFLDEVDVLADNIVILSKGRVQCQGSAAELKSIHGGGYKVIVPRNAPEHNVAYPHTIHQDRRVYLTPDSHSAAALASSFASHGTTDVEVTGPQVEDVFLSVADDLDLELNKVEETITEADFKMTPGQILPFWAQVKVLFRKRFTVLVRFWWPYFYALALPLVIVPLLKSLLKDYEQPSCAFLDQSSSYAYPFSYYASGNCTEEPYSCDGNFSIGPQSANDSMFDLVEKGYSSVAEINATYFSTFTNVYDSRESFTDSIINNLENTDRYADGGVYVGSADEATLLSYRVDSSQNHGNNVLTLWSEIKSGMEIISLITGFSQAIKEALNIGVIYIIFFTLVQALYPAAFVLYPAIEKAHKVRALQYANGVRRGPLWVAYGLFDSIFVLLSSIAVTAILMVQVDWNGPVWIMFPILLLYGIAGVLLGYVISHFVSGPLKSFLATAVVNLLMYAISTIAFAVGSGSADAASLDRVTRGINFGLNLILPIGNVWRAALLGMNVSQIGCDNGKAIAPGSIFAYGGPILYLVIQVIALGGLIIWLEGDLALFRRKSVKHSFEDNEKDFVPGEVKAERTRVEDDEVDLLRVVHIDKSFGSNHALQDVTLGLPQGDVMALLGPNGAGKSTLVNLIQSELSPDRGRILIKGEDSRTRSAQMHLGVCPQYDALDLMNTQDQLSFYARVKGIKDAKANVDHVMSRLGLTPHAKTFCSKLSGGNKRKLSLAIALMGTPSVLVLDEPTSAMDAIAKRAFWKLIQDIVPGRSLLLTTHSMEEADTLATRAAIISKSLLAVGTTQALRAKYSNLCHLSIVLASAPASSEHEMEQVRSWFFEKVPGAKLERVMLGGQLRLLVPGTGAQGHSPAAGIIEMLENDKDALGIQYYSIGGATLENVFLSVVQGNGVEEEDGNGYKGGILGRFF